MPPCEKSPYLRPSAAFGECAHSARLPNRISSSKPVPERCPRYASPIPDTRTTAECERTRRSVCWISSASRRLPAIRAAWARAARMAGRRREALEIQHTDRRVRSHSAVVRVSGMGLAYRGQRSGTGLLEEILFGNRAEWAHSPNAAEGRRYGDFSHGGIDGVSTAAARQS